VERINLIVQQLLDFAKPAPPKLIPVDVPRLLDETLELLNGELVHRHVQVQRYYKGSERVLGDPQQLKQVFINLVLNSLQAVNGGARLELRTAVEGSSLSVTIADNGCGIAPKDLPHVFEPFYTTKATGTGLGLAVAQGIVTEHGGQIAVESQMGRGTRLVLRLPIAT
jgi:signal transduction histidine kinase